MLKRSPDLWVGSYDFFTKIVQKLPANSCLVELGTLDAGTTALMEAAQPNANHRIYSVDLVLTEKASQFFSNSTATFICG